MIINGSAGDHEREVGDEADHLVDHARPVAGDQAERHRDQRGQHAGAQSDEQRHPRPVHHLREHVLAVAGGAEPVRATRDSGTA